MEKTACPLGVFETDRVLRRERRGKGAEKDAPTDVNQSIDSVRVRSRPYELPSRERQTDQHHCQKHLQETETERGNESERETEGGNYMIGIRPEITILSAEPISSWFPGAGFPPPPPPAAQIWGSSLAPDILPPPSYEEVIREKNQEQVIVPAAAALPPSLSSSPQQSICTTTIATQTDAKSTQEAQPEEQVRRPHRPPRPILSNSTQKPSKPDVTLDQSVSFLPNGDSASSVSTQTPPSEPHSSPSASSEVQAVRQRPKPRPRSKLNLQPVRDEVKVQTLVKLREDGLRTLAARAKENNHASNPEVTGGKYLQELLEAFSSDDWGFPEQRSASQSESEDESKEEATEYEQEEDMATLRARIQAFEQMHDGNFEETKSEPSEPPKQRPEPKPRPRLPQNKPPVVSPKPKNISNSSDVLNSMDSKGFWEDDGHSVDTLEQNETSEKPMLAPKPELNIEPVYIAPVPLPRPTPSLCQPKLPPDLPSHPGLDPEDNPRNEAQVWGKRHLRCPEACCGYKK
ncbi:hypothetical protein WMY93_014671 [Mugilogobius chulae]|uniref:Uncharacterized protein n=1 Tax=Mugilogobius chulae TaxID=88201 RepID=A0AAW0P738_9GOBI